MLADILLIILAATLGVAGIIGSFLPVLPGPPLSWLGLLVMYLRFDSVSGTMLLAWLGVTIVVTVIDFLFPAWLTRISGASKASGWGATIGMLIGIFFSPVGMIVLGMLGAFVAELAWGSKSGITSIVAALGAFAGFFVGTFIKLVASACMLWLIVAAAL